MTDCSMGDTEAIGRCTGCGKPFCEDHSYWKWHVCEAKS
jgi:hypothetical protein